MGRKKQKRLLTVNPNPPVSIPVKPQPIKHEVQMSNENRKVKQVKEYEGMFTCILEHEVTKTTATYEWTGPKMSPEVWNQVLAFFRWTYDTTKSESQVRLFVNHRTREWAAWAFPQRARTGMAAHEIDLGEPGYDLTMAQREQFTHEAGWTYYGTAHHHCSGGAFQSGVDQKNEFNQSGLHITVGCIGSDQYDLDFRLYERGYKLGALNMLEFWDVGDPLSGVPERIKKLLPEDALVRFVKIQMGTPPPADQVFPDVWKTNLILPPPVVHQFPQNNYSPNHFYGTGGYYRKSYYNRSIGDLEWDTKRAVEELMKYLNDLPPAMKMTLNEVIIMLKDIEKTIDPDYLDLIDIFTHADAKLDSFIKAVEQKRDFLAAYDKAKEDRKKIPLQLGNGKSQTSEELQQELREVMEAEGGILSDYGHPHYHGWGDGMGLGG